MIGHSNDFTITLLQSGDKHILHGAIDFLLTFCHNDDADYFMM